MCGLCGWFDRRPERREDRRVARDRLVRMSEVVAHRGPDGDGYHLDVGVGLAHRRLGIIDLEGGAQPQYSEDRSVVVVFNGEIYNFRSLRDELSGRGHRFRTRSDTEVIVHAYEEYGDGCVERLRGMFAFAVWDRRRRRLLLARDRLGIKPLYYHRGGERLTFASEVKSLLMLPEVEREVDVEALDLYLSLRYVPGPRTMFRDIRKLQPGHLLVADREGVRVRQYWDVDFDPARRLGDAGCRERFEELLHEAVRMRLIADVPLGVFLSGGLDSSSILSMMTGLRRAARDDSPLDSFSVGYERDDQRTGPAAGGRERGGRWSASLAGRDGSVGACDERAFARLAARRFGSRHHEVELSAADFGDFLEDMVWHLDEPLADPTCAPLYYLSRRARQHVTVVLSGEGADEILGGYGIYRRMLALERVRRRIPGPALRLLSAAGSLAPGERLRHGLELAAAPLERGYTGVSRAFRPELKAELLGRDRRAAMERVEALFASHYAAVADASPLDRMLYVDTKVWLPDDLLLKADRMTMANSMELRVPFLDHELVQFAADLPLHMKLGARDGKQLLRDTVGRTLPRPIVERAKKGFPVPTGRWLRGPLAPRLRETLLSPGASCSSYLDRDVVSRLVDEHLGGRADRTQELWTLLVFSTWHRLFVEGAPPAAADRRLATPDREPQRAAGSAATGSAAAARAVPGAPAPGATGPRRDR